MGVDGKMRWMFGLGSGLVVVVTRLRRLQRGDGDLYKTGCGS